MLVRQRPFITNFMDEDLVIIEFFFIGSYGIDTNVIHLLELFEHRCHVHCLYMNVICLFVLFKQGYRMSICHTSKYFEVFKCESQSVNNGRKKNWNTFFSL